MALVVKDRVQVTSTTTGTGTFTLGSAVTGFQDFSVIGNGNTTYYAIVGGTEWEVGLGTYTSSGTTLSRNTILESSNGGTAVNFSAGTKNVFVTYPAEKSSYFDANGNLGIGSEPPSPMAMGASIGANGIIHTPTSEQLSLANNAYFDGTNWKARATQSGYGAFRYNAAGAGTVSIHSNSSAFTAGDTLSQMDGTDQNFIFYANGALQLKKATGTLQNSSGRTILNQTGSILQVVNATYATQTTTNSTTMVDTGLSATITPSSTSSKILVIVQQTGCGKDTNDTSLQLRLMRGTTELFEFESSGGWTGAAGRNFIGTCGCAYLDSPATTSATTYKTQQASFNGGANTFTQYNVGSGNPTSTITLLEIAG